MASDGIKRIDIKEFRELGYVQELNRQFLHPLGLALEVVITAEGEALGGIWDYRDDDDGMHYAPGVINPAKAAFIQAEKLKRAPVRQERYGYTVQPVPGGSE